jgi:NADH-quinone oxidoreductase subunit N
MMSIFAQQPPQPELFLPEPETQIGLLTPSVDWEAFLPQLILVVGALLILTVVSLVKDKLPKGSYATMAVVVAGAALVSTYPLWNRVQNPDEGPTSTVAGAVALDGFGVFITGVICIGVILAALLADDYLRREKLDGPEFYVLMLLSAAGGVTMATANDLIVLFIGLEALSMAVYVLAAMHSRRVSSQEAGMKYFVLGAFTSAILLYGIALVYGATGSTNLADIQEYLSTTVILEDGMLLAGLALMLVGFGFKVAAVPFHSWAPDVYQGSPTPAAAFMAAAVKAAAFAGLLRVFVVTFPTFELKWGPMVYALALLSLVIGAVLGLVQGNIKRMLAYSSINHAGFILLGVWASSDAGIAAVLFYLGAYTFMVMGSFGVVLLVGRAGDGHHLLDDYRGLSRSNPLLALVFTVFLLAQAGVPFTAGFMAKFGVIGAAADNDGWVLAGIAMLSAAVSAFIYLRIVGTMYFSDRDEEPATPRLRIPVSAGLALGIALVFTIALGVAPDPFTDLAGDATARLVLAGP